MAATVMMPAWIVDRAPPRIVSAMVVMVVMAMVVMTCTAVVGVRVRTREERLEGSPARIGQV